MTESIIIPCGVARQFAADLFERAGVESNESAIVSRSLVESNLRGHDSHGIVRVPDYLRQLEAGALVPSAEMTLINETDSLVVCDANFGFGQIQAGRLCDLLVPKANAQGVACGTMRNSGHVGRLGEWVERIAQQGLAGLIAVNDNGVLKCVSPPGGTQPRISTNPLAIAVPLSTGSTSAGHAMRATDPLVLDMSTSVVANGKVTVARLADRECPDGWLLDSAGQPTTDPNVRFREPIGSILPLGGTDHGFKGFGLGLLLDILIGGLSGGACPPAQPSDRDCNNVLMMAWSPGSFAGESHFINEANKLVEYVRSTETRADIDRIRLPGDRSNECAAERRAKGLPIDDGTWSSLTDAAHVLSVDIPAVH